MGSGAPLWSTGSVTAPRSIIGLPLRGYSGTAGALPTTVKNIFGSYPNAAILARPRETYTATLLVMVGVRVDGTKELVALAEGYRESAGSWADLLRDCKRRGMRTPVLAVGDGALGFWTALREVFPDAREQRCWFHKIGNVLYTYRP